MIAPFASRARTLRPGRPGERTVARERQRVDPLALLVRDLLHAAIGLRRDDAAIVAASDEPLAVARGNQDRAVRMGGDAARLAGPGKEHLPVGQREDGRAAEKGGGDDLRRRLRSASSIQ